MDVKNGSPAKENDKDLAITAGAIEPDDSDKDSDNQNEEDQNMPPEDDPSPEEIKMRRQKQARKLRKNKRNTIIDEIKSSAENEEEIKEIMDSQGQQEGAFCTILFTMCFIFTFLLEIGGHRTGEQYQMHHVLSQQFENRILDLEWYKKAYDEDDPTRYLNDYKTIHDIHDIEGLRKFALYAVDLLYPINRTNSADESFYSSHDNENLKYEQQQQWLIGNGTEKEEGDPITIFNYFNYYCGMEFRVREGAIEPNTNNKTRRVITHQKVNGGYSNSEDDWEDEYGVEVDHHYFPGSITREEAFAQLNELLEDGWINSTVHQPMTNTKFIFAFYNQNVNLGMFLEYTFYRSDSGFIEFEKSSRIFKPQQHVESDSGGKTMIEGLKETMNLFWGIYWANFFIYAVIDILIRIKIFFTKRTLELDWHKYIDYVILVLTLMVIIMYNELFSESSTYQTGFRLPMDEEMFEQMETMSERIITYKVICSVISILLMVKNLRTLTSKFPSFGVLFETIDAAKGDLMYFSIITGVMVISFTMICYSLFGCNEELFSTVKKSTMSIVELIFGFDLYPKLQKANPKASLIFLIVFSVFIYFVILNVYAAIVMRTYDNLRQKKQILTEAMADIAAKTAQEQSNKVWNVLTCSMNRVTVDDSDEESEDSSSDDEDVGLTQVQFDKKMEREGLTLTKQEIEKRQERFNLSYAENVRRQRIRKEYQKKLDKDAEDDQKQQDADLQKRIKYNIGVLMEFFMQLASLNAEQDSIQAFEEKIKNAKAKIVKRKWNHKEERIRNFSGMKGNDSYIQLRNSVIFIFFIFAYIRMLYNQQHQFEAIEVKKVTSINLKERLSYIPYKTYQGQMHEGVTFKQIRKHTYDDIQNIGDIQDFIKQPLYQYLHNREENLLNYGGNTIMTSKGLNPVTGENKDEIGRILINFHNEKENPNENTLQAFSNQTSLFTTNGLTLNMTDPPNVEGFGEPNITKTDDFIDEDSGLEFKFLVTQKNDAQPITPDGSSGFLFPIPSDPNDAAELFEKIYQSDFNKKFQKVCQVNIDFVVFNVNYNLFSYVEMEFFIDSVGYVTKKMRFTKSEFDHFDTSNDSSVDQKQRTILLWEIIFLCFVIFETVKIINNLKAEWLFLTSLEIPPKYRAQDGKLMQFIHRCGIDPNLIEGRNFIVIFYNVIKGICISIIKLVLKIIILLTNILQKSFFNALDMVSIILYYVTIAFWIKIVIEGKFIMDEETGVPTNVLQVSNQMSHLYDSYTRVTTVNIFLIFIRFMQYFAFSQQLSSYFEIIGQASFDILFFSILWCVMLIGFSVAFFAMFGLQMKELMTLQKSFLYTLKISMSLFPYEEMVAINREFTTVIFIVFMGIFKILLYNMFIAIISAHYFEYQREHVSESSDEEEASIIELIVSIVRNKLNSKDDDDDQKSDQPEMDLNKNDPKSKKKVEKQDVFKKMETFSKSMFKELDILNEDGEASDDDEKEERVLEIERHKQAIQSKHDEPDILDYKTNNVGLKPFLQNLQMAKLGPKALKHAQMLKEQQAVRSVANFEPADLVNANLWLQVLEDKLSKVSNYNLSLYDFQNHDTVFSDQVEKLNIDELSVIQKQLLKTQPESRFEFIKKKCRIYESQGNKDKKSTVDNYKSKIDNIYLIWKALEFEHLYDQVNLENDDQFFNLIDFINQIEKLKSSNSNKSQHPQNKSAQQTRREDLSPAEKIELQNKLDSEKEMKENQTRISQEAVIKYQYLIQSKIKKDKNFNRVTELMHQVWTQFLDNYEQHVLWFHLFDTLDRVRLWNTLVFSDGYFRILSSSSKYNRKDLSQFYTDKISSKIKQEYTEIRDKFMEDQKEMGKTCETYSRDGELPIEVEVDGSRQQIPMSKDRQREIRDKFYTPDIMLQFWNKIKLRQYEVVLDEQEKKELQLENLKNSSRKRASARGTDNSEDNEKNMSTGRTDMDGEKEDQDHVQTKTKTMEIEPFMEMIRSLFKVMIHGVSRDRLVIMMQEAIKLPSFKKNDQVKNLLETNLDGKSLLFFNVFKNLVTETFDQTEYRLPLWLPLSLEQKLDMVLHQRVDEEVEMMQFLIDEELGCGLNQEATSLKKYDTVDKMLEQALDSQIFDKYLTMTRIQATNTSLKMCEQRIEDHKLEDENLHTYANFLIDKLETGGKYEEQLRKNITKLQRTNAQLVKKIRNQMKQEKPAR